MSMKGVMDDDKRTLRVASVQFESQPGGKETNFRKIETFVERAAQQDVRLIVPTFKNSTRCYGARDEVHGQR